MLSLMVIIDGLGDDPIKEFNMLTPFDYASHPALDRLLESGKRTDISICGEDFVPESTGCILRLLGVAQKYFPQNRAYLELLAHEQELKDNEIVMRCNLVSVAEDGRLSSFNAAGLAANEIKDLVEVFGKITGEGKFLHLSDYRNLLILPKNAQLLTTVVRPPHESVGEPVAELLNDFVNASDDLRAFVAEANAAMADLLPGRAKYMLYPWGPAEKTELPPFKFLHNKTGAVVAQAEIVRGIGKALEMYAPHIFGATADVDTNITVKTKATLDYLNHFEFVLTHFNGTDEAAHRYDYQSKAEFISRIDREFFAPLLAGCRQPFKLIVCGDHGTSSLTGKHTTGTVPVIAYCTDAKLLTEINSYQDIWRFLN